jgi:hypothetical protein
MSAFEMPGATARLVCDPGESPHVEVAVYDGRLEPLPLSYNLGRVEVGVVPGAYKVEFRMGAETITRIAVVAEGETHEVWPGAPISVASAAPLAGSSTSHEYQQGPAAWESTQTPLPPPPGQTGGSHLFLFVRDHDEEAWTGENPAAGLSLHRLDGTLLYDLDEVREEESAPRHARYSAQGHWTSLHAELDPGAYLLRLRTASKGVVQQVVHLSAGWQTQLFLLARSYGRRDERRRQADLARGSVFMTKAVGFQPGEQQLYLTEVALRALADGRAVPGGEHADMLDGKFENPMLGLFSAYLHLRRPAMDPGLMGTVFHNLLALLGPHPDVVALGWAIVARWAREGHPAEGLDPIRRAVEGAGALAVPPMLRASADALAKASYTNRGVVALDSLTERVAARMLLSGPWLVWTATADELRETPLPPAAAPRVEDTLEELRLPGAKNRPNARFRLNSIQFGETIQAWEAPRAAPPFAPQAHESVSRGDDPEPEPVLATMQRSMDDVSRRLKAKPELAERLLSDPSLTPLERRVALAAFPETDPLFGAMARRRSSAVSALLQSTRPTAEELAATLGAPAGTLSRAVLGIAARMQDVR